MDRRFHPRRRRPENDEILLVPVYWSAESFKGGACNWNSSVRVIKMNNWIECGRTMKFLGAVVIALSLVGLGGCTTFPRAPATASVDYNYKIGPGDTINIVVWRNPELSMVVTVRPDGKLASPLVENMVAIGKDPSTLARDIEKALAKVIRDPVVTVVVNTFVGPYSEQIRVLGEATRPQVLAYKQKMTLLDVMIAVGGITDFADGNAARLVRTADGGKQYSLRIKDLIKRGDVSANIEMLPGDVLIIPESWF